MATRKKEAVEEVPQEETFAQMENRVRQILEELSKDGVGLDRQVALGEEGTKLLDRMSAKLEELEKRVANISKASGSEE